MKGQDSERQCRVVQDSEGKYRTVQETAQNGAGHCIKVQSIAGQCNTQVRNVPILKDTNILMH